MTAKEAQKVLDELNGVRPEALNGEAKRLFEAIMKIADERDEAYKIIDLMTNFLNEFDIDEKICKSVNCGKEDETEPNCIDCIKNILQE